MEKRILRGIWTTHIYHESGFQVGTLEQEEGPMLEVTCVSTLNLNGLYVQANGKAEHHKVYGKQWRLTDVMITSSKSHIARNLLSSGLLKGIGPAKAQAMSMRWGDEVFDHINEADLLSIQGIGMSTALTILESWSLVEDRIDSIFFAVEHGLNLTQAMRLHDKYGESLRWTIEDNPYVIMQVPRIGWKTAEKLATRMGFDMEDPRRYQAATRVVLSQEADRGHTYTPKETVWKELQKMLRPYCNRAKWEDSLITAPPDVVYIHDDDEALSLPELFSAEEEISMHIRRLQDHARQLHLPIPKDTQLNKEQLQGVRNGLTCGVSVITGDAGTGKTLTTNTLVKILQDGRRTLELCAPTGMAAKRMANVTDTHAQTIHRLLGLRYEEDQGLTQLLADVIIVDESSMVDIRLAKKLLRAVRSGAHIIFVGDAFQLPSVGPGEFLRDIILGGVPTTKLTQVYRAAQNSGIVYNANLLRNRSKHREPMNLQDYPDVHHWPATNLRNVARMLAQDTTVLAGFRSDVAELNQMLQELRNPKSKHTHIKIRKDMVFAVDDEVRQTRNDYDLEVFNGEVGVVSWIEENEDDMLGVWPVVKVQYPDREVSYTRDKASYLTLAYALTIHSAQGSEWKKVAVLVPYRDGWFTQQHFMTASLFYTAMTRAMDDLTFITLSDKALKHYRSATAYHRRRTSLEGLLTT